MSRRGFTHPLDCPFVVLILGQTVIEHWPGRSRITLPDGAQVHAVPPDTDEYRETARHLGYGDDLASMAIDHDTAHALLAHLAGLPESPTLRSLAHGGAPTPLTDLEEAAVLSLQAFCNTAGIDLLALARQHSR